MIKKNITYIDPDGTTQSEDHYFNITVQQIVEDQMVAGDDASTESVFTRIQNFDPEKARGRDIMNLFRDMIKLSYGIRSEDGKRFIRSEEITNDFMQSFAYDELYGQLITNAETASEFVENLFPKRILDQVTAQAEGKTLSEIARERSEQALQGHKSAPTPSSVETVPDAEELRVVENESEEDEKARKRAELEAQLADLN